MRIRYMTLPSEVVGEIVQTPFILVIDKVAKEDAQSLPEALQGLKLSSGARGLFLATSEVEIGESL